MDEQDIYTCPFCGFKNDSDYQILLHVEVQHSENGDSPFAVQNSIVPSSSKQPTPEPPSHHSPAPATSRLTHSTNTYVDCPYKCGERILSTELQFHTDFHVAEDMALEDSGLDSGVELSTGACNDEQIVKDITTSFSTGISSSIRNYGQLSVQPTSSNERRRATSLKELFFGSPNRKRATSHRTSSKSGRVKRLGTAELGPYAHEKRMPAWLEQMLEEGAKVTISNKIGPHGTLVRVEAIANETPDLVPVLARMSLLDRTVARAFYCSSEIRHIAKMPKEGGFCGYRNIQMLISYIRDSKAPGHQHFTVGIPSIIRLQDMIEDAWDKGYNSSGRIETGGVRLTRKYIGTPEAQALFLGLGVACEAVAYSSHGGTDAYTTLMSAVFSYFEDDRTRDDNHRVFITEKPPIYFQHQGHSMTIVGVEVHRNGAANLVVFDPMFNPSPTLKRLVGTTSFRCSDPTRLMKAHRRGELYLSKYKDFELLKLSNYDPEGWSGNQGEGQ